MLPAGLVHLLRTRDGVVSRAEALAMGLTADDVRRFLRTRQLAVVHPGVYVDHTGPPTWRQRAWAAVLTTGGALYGESAVRAVTMKQDVTDRGPIHVAVDRKRHVHPPSGVIVHPTTLGDRVLWHASPPRFRLEDALVDLAAGASTDFGAVAHLADAVQARLTTAGRLRNTLVARPRLRRRRLLLAALGDIEDGTCSVLEREYLCRVERPHGLPPPRRQAPGAGSRPSLRDIDYPQYGVVIELDGRLFHDNSRSRDADLERDLDSAVGDGRRTVRLGWGQVVERSCGTARKIGALLAKGGWAGAVTSCPSCR